MPAQDTFKTYRAVSHSIKAPNEWPLANFIVFLNRQGWANRAELYFNADALEQNGLGSDSVEEWEEFALVAANKIVDENYTAYKADSTKLEVRLLHVEQRRRTEHFDLDYIETVKKESIFEPWLLAAIGAILMILLGVVWGFSTLLNRPTFQAVDDGADDDGAVRVAASDGGAINGDSQAITQSNSSDGGANGNGSSNEVNSSRSANADGTIAIAFVDPSLPQTNSLPPSVNANNNLRLGQRIRVVPGSALTLRSQPGASDGEELGFMENSQEATIVGGPYWVQGQSDTIIWWYVELDDGTQAWAPANDSQFTVLEPAPKG